MKQSEQDFKRVRELRNELIKFEDRGSGRVRRPQRITIRLGSHVDLGFSVLTHLEKQHGDITRHPLQATLREMFHAPYMTASGMEDVFFEHRVRRPVPGIFYRLEQALAEFLDVPSLVNPAYEKWEQDASGSESQ